MVAGADLEEAWSEGRGHLEFVMTLERLDERAEEWGQPFAAEIVAGLPHAGEEFDHLGPVAWWTATVPARCPRRLPQPSNGRLAVTSRDLAKLIQQSRLFRTSGRAISTTEGSGVFADALRSHDAS